MSRKRTPLKVVFVSPTEPRFASVEEAIQAAVPALARLINSHNATKQPVEVAATPETESNDLQEHTYTLAVLRAMTP